MNEELLIQLRLLFYNLDYDLMAFQRVLYNTRAFQSQGSLTPAEGVEYQFPGPLIRRMTAEQTWDSFVTLAKGPGVNDYESPRLEEMSRFDIFEPDAFNELNRSNRDWYAELFKEGEDRSREIHKKSLRIAGGMQKKKYLVRASELRIPTFDSHFLRMFGQSNREVSGDGSREGGVPQVLMLLNGDVNRIFEDRESYFYKKLRSLSEGQQMESLYHSFLSREPSKEEKQLLMSGKMSIPAIAWILVNTREFMFIL